MTALGTTYWILAITSTAPGVVVPAGPPQDVPPTAVYRVWGRYWTQLECILAQRAMALSWYEVPFEDQPQLRCVEVPLQPNQYDDS